MDFKSRLCCHLCLRIDPGLTLLGCMQPVYEILINKLSYNKELSFDSVVACFQCHANMAWIKKFRERIHRSHIIMLSQLHDTKYESFDVSAEDACRFKSSTKHTYDFTFQHEDMESPFKQEPKVEIDEDIENDNLSYFDTTFADIATLESDDDTISKLKGDMPKLYEIRNKGFKRTKASKNHRNLKGKYNQIAKRRQRVKIDKDGKTEWKCHTCGKTFSTRGMYWYHNRTAHIEAKYLCNECGKKFKMKPHLEKHMMLHFGGAPKPPQHPCPVCGRTFAGRSGVRSHMANVHPTDANQFMRCDACDLTFKTKYKYREHIKWSRKHGGVGTEKHQCEKCNRRYKTKQRLLEHYNYQHLGVALHSCHICGKSISTQLGLQKHIRNVHEGFEGPRCHICETCGDTFKSPSMLRQHGYIHTGEKPYPCHQCSAVFRQKGSLHTHVRLVHLKIKRRSSTVGSPT